MAVRKPKSLTHEQLSEAAQREEVWAERRVARKAVPLTAKLKRQVEKLIGGVEVDMDAPLLPEEPEGADSTLHQLQHWDDAPRVARKVVKRVTEAKIQAQCVAWARARGWWARKFQSMAQKSVPDYLFSRFCESADASFNTPATRVKLAVEFKKPGEVSTENQWAEQYDMWLAGWQVEECDSLEKFKRIILAAEQQF